MKIVEQSLEDTYILKVRSERNVIDDIEKELSAFGG